MFNLFQFFRRLWRNEGDLACHAKITPPLAVKRGQEIIDAVKSGDRPKAERLIREHILDETD